MNRREFSQSVRVQIIRRATRGLGTVDKVYCERCLLPARKWEIHHRVMDAMEVDKRRKLTAADGELLCESCHDPITSAQRKDLTRAKAREASHIGAKPPSKRPIPQRHKAEKPAKEASGKLPTKRADGETNLWRRFRNE